MTRGAQQGHPMQYVGHADKFDEVLIDGDLEGGKFMAFYIHNNQTKAALGMGRDKEMVIVQELMRNGTMPVANEIKNGVDWEHALS